VTESPLLLDACACINLAAAFPLATLESTLGRPVRIVEQAAAEALFLHQEVDGQRVKIPIDVGVIETVRLDGRPELELYIRLAKRLGDGEAASLSISHHREVEVVTDDRVARRLAAADAPKARVRGTAKILRALTSSMGLENKEVSDAIRRVETQATFRPPNNDPDLEWWLAAREPCD
jgi:predicted nucleic acid-binding protein